MFGIQLGQGSHNGFHGEAGYHRSLDVGDIHGFVFAALELVDGLVDDFVGFGAGGLFAEFNVGRVGDLGNLHGGDDLGANAFGRIDHSRHDALVIHHHGIQCAGYDGHLLAHRMGTSGDAMTHHNLVAGAANAHQVDARGAGRFGRLLFGLGGHDQHFGQYRIVAVQGDVDRLGLEGSQVGRGDGGLGNTEENVGQVSAHVAAGQVRHAAAQSSQQQVDGIGVHPVKGAVHDLRNFVIDSFGYQVQVSEHLGPLRVDHGGSPEHRRLFLMKIGQGGMGHIQGNVLIRPVRGFDIQARGNGPELVGCLDRVGLGLAQGHFFQGVGQMLGMAGMGSRTGGDGAVQASGHHDIGRSTANSFFGTFAEGIDATGALQAVAAAQAGIAEIALGRHGGIPIPDRS